MTSPDSPSLSRGTPETRDAQLLGIYGRFMRAIRRAYHQASWTAVDVALGAFNTECDTLPPLDEPKVIQSAPALSEGEPTPAPEKLPTLAESNAPNYGRGPKEPCAGCGSTNWAWRWGMRGPLPNTCSKCEAIPVSSSLSTSSPEPEMNELLGTLTRVCQHLGAAFVKMGVPLPELKDGERDLTISAARSAIELSFATLTEEIKRLKKQTETDLYVMGEIIAARDSIVAERNGLLSENERLQNG